VYEAPVVLEVTTSEFREGYRTERGGAIMRRSNFYDTFSRFDTISACEGQVDRRNCRNNITGFTFVNKIGRTIEKLFNHPLPVALTLSTATDFPNGNSRQRPQKEVAAYRHVCPREGTRGTRTFVHKRHHLESAQNSASLNFSN